MFSKAFIIAWDCNCLNLFNAEYVELANMRINNYLSEPKNLIRTVFHDKYFSINKENNCMILNCK